MTRSLDSRSTTTPPTSSSCGTTLAAGTAPQHARATADPQDLEGQTDGRHGRTRPGEQTSGEVWPVRSDRRRSARLPDPGRPVGTRDGSRWIRSCSRAGIRAHASCCGEGRIRTCVDL